MKNSRRGFIFYMSTNNNNTSSNSEIPLKLSEALEESGIIHKFVIDTKDKYVRLRLNSKYNPPVSLDVSLSVIKEKKWLGKVFK